MYVYTKNISTKTLGIVKMTFHKEQKNPSGSKFFVVVNDEIMFLFKGDNNHLLESELTAAGFEAVDKTNKLHYNQKGNFAGYPRLFIYMSVPCTGSDIEPTFLAADMVTYKHSAKWCVNQVLEMYKRYLAKI